MYALQSHKPASCPADDDDESRDSGSEWQPSLGDDDIRLNGRRKPVSGPFRILAMVPELFWRRENAYDYQAASTDEAQEGLLKTRTHEDPRRRRCIRIGRLLYRSICALPFVILMLFGMLHLILVILGRKNIIWDTQQSSTYLPHWSEPGHPGDNVAHYPTDATRGVQPIPCHSHNDYWRRIPLFDAIHAGCTSVEADVWLFDEEEDLFVGHNTISLTRNRTLISLYVDPLVRLLDSMNPSTEFADANGNGVFDVDPKQTLVLLIDFKTDGDKLFPLVQKQLEPLRSKNYLSFWNGKKFISRAVTVVGTGNTPFDLLVEDHSYRDIFFDAPLDELWEEPDSQPKEPHNNQATAPEPTKRTTGQGKTGTSTPQGSGHTFNNSNSYYASTSFQAQFWVPWNGELSSSQLNTIRGQIKGARSRGLKARYWETPAWPTSLRNHIWDVLVREGADVLNVDDLQAATRLDWTTYTPHGLFDAR